MVGEFGKRDPARSRRDLRILGTLHSQHRSTRRICHPAGSARYAPACSPQWRARRGASTRNSAFSGKLTRPGISWMRASAPASRSACKLYSAIRRAVGRTGKAGRDLGRDVLDVAAHVGGRNSFEDFTPATSMPPWSAFLGRDPAPGTALPPDRQRERPRDRSLARSRPAPRPTAAAALTCRCPDRRHQHRRGRIDVMTMPHLAPGRDPPYKRFGNKTSKGGPPCCRAARSGISPLAPCTAFIAPASELGRTPHAPTSPSGGRNGRAPNDWPVSCRLRARSLPGFRRTAYAAARRCPCPDKQLQQAPLPAAPGGLAAPRRAAAHHHHRQRLELSASARVARPESSGSDGAA